MSDSTLSEYSDGASSQESDQRAVSIHGSQQQHFDDAYSVEEATPNNQEQSSSIHSSFRRHRFQHEVEPEGHWALSVADIGQDHEDLFTQGTDAIATTVGAQYRDDWPVMQERDDGLPIDYDILTSQEPPYPLWRYFGRTAPPRSRFRRVRLTAAQRQTLPGRMAVQDADQLPPRITVAFHID